MKNPLLTVALAGLITFIFGGDNANAVPAFSLSGIIKQAEVIKVNAVTAVTNSAITVSTTIRGFAANDPYQIKSLTVPKSSFMTHVKGGIGTLAKENAWYAAWALSVGAAGWAINELTQQMEYHPVLQVGNGFPVGTVFSTCILIGDGGSTIITRTNSNMSNCMAATASFVNFKIVGSFSPQGSFYQAPITYCFASQPTVCWPTGYIRVYSSVAPTPIISPSEPVSDNSLYDSITAFMMQDPTKAAQAFMAPGAYPYPYPNLMPNTTPYIPGVSQSDQDLLDLYSQGLLQSTNPNAANYVSPEKYSAIAALAGQLQQGATPDSQVAAANDQLKKPLTQKELEESLKKEREAEDKATKESLGPQPVLNTLLDPYKQFEDGVKATPNDQVNALPTNNFIVGGNGQCYVITKTVNIMGQSMTLSTQGVCEEFYYPYFLPILTWLFYVSTGIYVWFCIRDAFERRV